MMHLKSVSTHQTTKSSVNIIVIRYQFSYVLNHVMSFLFSTLVPSMLPRKKTQAVKDEVMRLDVRHSHSFYYVSTNLSKIVHALKIKSLPKYISYLKYVLICMMHICCPLVKSSCYVAKECLKYF